MHLLAGTYPKPSLGVQFLGYPQGVKWFSQRIRARGAAPNADLLSDLIVLHGFPSWLTQSERRLPRQWTLSGTDVRRWPCLLVRRYVYYIPPSPYENKLGGIPTNPLLHLEPPLGQEPFIFEYGVVHTNRTRHRTAWKL